MKKKPFIWGILGGILFFFCGVVPSLSGSLWFLEELVGRSEGGYTIGYSARFVDSNELVKNIKEQHRETIPEILDAYNRVVYRKNQGGEYMAGVPKLSSQFSLTNKLREESWDVHRIGWVVYANKGSGEVSNSFQAMGNTIAAIFWERLPAFPRFIAQVKDTTHESTALYIEEVGSGLHGVVNTGSDMFSRGVQKRIVKNNGGSELSYVSIQRDILDLLPIGMKTSVENKVSESMHFTKTRPQILDNLVSIAPSVVVARRGDSFAIGLPSTDERAAKMLHTWIHAEQGTRHPQRRAFSLPDKTLGYEYIPGASNAYFSLNKANNNCLPSEEYDERLFLCAKDSSVVFSTDEALGSSLLASLKDSAVFQKGIIQGEILDALHLHQYVQSMEYGISDEMIEFWVDKKIQ